MFSKMIDDSYNSSIFKLGMAYAKKYVAEALNARCDTDGATFITITGVNGLRFTLRQCKISMFTCPALEPQPGSFISPMTAEEEEFVVDVCRKISKYVYMMVMEICQYDEDGDEIDFSFPGICIGGVGNGVGPDGEGQEGEEGEDFDPLPNYLDEQEIAGFCFQSVKQFLKMFNCSNGSLNELGPDGTDLYTFESLKAFTNLLEQNKACYYYTKNAASWVGRYLPTMDSALEAVSNKWDTGVQICDAMVREIADKVKNIQTTDNRRRTKFQNEGDEVDFDRLRAGQDYWRQTKRENISQTGTVQIVTDLSANRSYSADEMLWRGASAIALAYILESRGFRTQICVMAGSIRHDVKNPEHKYALFLELKREQDPCDITSMINVAAGWFYRSLGFSFKKLLVRQKSGKLHDQLGIPNTPNQSCIDKAIGENCNRITITHVFSPGAAINLVEDELRKFQV